MLHYIYCYTNNINNKKYIGQTNNLNRRIKQHLQDSFHNYDENRYNQVIHQAIRKYGYHNFIIEVLDTINTENLEDVNQLEVFYINQKNTLSPNGYNLKAQGFSNRGRNSSLLNEKQIREIVQLLKNQIPINIIASQFDLSCSYVSQINCGSRLKQLNENYPLQKNRIDTETYLEIIDMISNTNYSLANIARYFGINKDTVSKINLGTQQIVRRLYDKSFPIRKQKQGYTLKPVETIPGETGSRAIIDK